MCPLQALMSNQLLAVLGLFEGPAPTRNVWFDGVVFGLVIGLLGCRATDLDERRLVGKVAQLPILVVAEGADHAHVLAQLLECALHLG